MNYTSKSIAGQAFLALLASMSGTCFLSEPAKSQPKPSFTPTPTATPTQHPLLQPAPAPIPTRNPDTPIYNKSIGGGASVDVNPNKQPPAAVEFQGPGSAKTRFGPVYMDGGPGGTGKPEHGGTDKPGQGGTDKPGQGGTGKPGQGGAGFGVNVTY